jgi:hypothetical protein
MTTDPAAMTDVQVKQYREAVAALVAACLQQLRAYPLPDEAGPDASGATPHE